jgi:hypothetical protein
MVDIIYHLNELEKFSLGIKPNDKKTNSLADISRMLFTRPDKIYRVVVILAGKL